MSAIVAQSECPQDLCIADHETDSNMSLASPQNNEITLTKEKELFRNYEDSSRQDLVMEHYRCMRIGQSLSFVHKLLRKYSFDQPRCHLTIREALEVLERFIDRSDPDLDLPNLVHVLQTAEGIRRAGLPDWMQLVGLLHDMGKIMFLWGTAEDGQEGHATGQQWSLGGDTCVVGCRLPDSAVFPQFNELNADMSDPALNTEYGIYTPHCGLDNLYFAYGHDEYMYRMLIANKCSIPKEGMAMIRLHSCYPLHSHGEYKHLLSTDGEDERMLGWIRDFNKFDLYTKTNQIVPIVDEVWSYYQTIIEKYGLGPGKLMW